MRRRELPNLVIGERFGLLTVVARVPDTSRYLCRCGCGNEREYYRSTLENVKSCGCKRTHSLIGKTFHHLTVVSQAENSRSGLTRWVCECSCGNKTVFSSDHLTRKTSPVKSCGCKRVSRGKDHRDWKGFGEISGNWFYNHVARERKNAKRPKVPVTIDAEFLWNLFLSQDRRCALSGILLTISNRGEYNTASVDRIRSDLGYEPGNVQFVHKHVNFMKRTYDQEYFIDMCRKVAEHSNG